MISKNVRAVEALTRDLVLTNDQLEKVASMLLNEFDKGLARATHTDAKVKMFPTFVRNVPNGTGKYEEGKFLALDLGGTNFRVLLVDISGTEMKLEQQQFAISKELMHGSGQQLFDHIASCLADFMSKHQIKDNRIPMGFTFSFPCKQEGLSKAKLVTWTKGFRCTDVEGHDVVELLREAIQRRKDIDVDVTALVNDATGTLMSCAHKNKQCRIGVIVGTGTNACYMELLENVKNIDPLDQDNLPQRMIVNTEWGAFGDNGVLDFVRTEFDDEIDCGSLNQGKQLFEKMISGMYMGELTRIILAKLCRAGYLFGGNVTEEMLTPHIINTSFVSFVESDQKGEYENTREALLKFNISNPSVEDCELTKLVCSRVSTRAAYLVSAAIATILNKIKRPHTTIGIDGSVYRFHPHFHNLMDKKIAELVHPEHKFDLMLSEDGSGRGAALVAAVATNEKNKTGFISLN